MLLVPGARAVRMGPLNRRIAIQRAGMVENEHGDKVDGYETLAAVWASAKPGGGRERLMSAQVAAEAPMVFWIRWSPTVAVVTTSDRVEYPPESGRLFDIVSVNEIGRREGIEIAGVARG